MYTRLFNVLKIGAEKIFGCCSLSVLVMEAGIQESTKALQEASVKPLHVMHIDVSASTIPFYRPVTPLSG